MIRLQVTVRHLMIGVVISAVTFALWDSYLQFRRVYWKSLARIHADKEFECMERAGADPISGLYRPPGVKAKSGGIMPSRIEASNSNMSILQRTLGHLPRESTPDV